MKTYARVDAGVVMEIIAPMADDEGNEIPISQRFTVDFIATLIDCTSVTPPPQQGWSYSGAKFAAPMLSSPSPATLAAAALSAGLTINSTATPTLNGTYACDLLSQADIVAIETSLNAGKGFPGGSTTFSYPDVSGAMHSFSQANFTNFAAAVRDYVYALKSVIGGATTALPSQSSTIA